MKQALALLFLAASASAAAGTLDTLIIGVQGGWCRANSPARGVYKLAMRLKSRQLSGVSVFTVANHHVEPALALIRERKPQHLVLYGQSLGGPAAIRLAQSSAALGIPVALLVEIDGVGGGGLLVPPNVAFAANLFQREGWLHGGAAIRPEDPMKTKILGNFEYHYRGKEVDESGENMAHRIFLGTHLKMENDPQVWNHVERLILEHLP